jgi:hypothetical protein
LHEQAGKQWLIAQQSESFANGRISFDNNAAGWTGKVTTHSVDTITTDSPRPRNWREWPSEVQAYVTIRTADGETGLPVADVDESTIQVERFPLPEASEFRLPSVVVAEQ